MCTRYVLPDQPSAEREFLPMTVWWKFEVRFNVAPCQYVPAIRLHEDQSEGVMLRWGLIPSWTVDEPTGPPKTRVHKERLEASTSCQSAWRAGQRCIVPMAGFYVWQLTAEGYRQPFYVALTDRTTFGVAGLWDRWVSEEDDVIESCAQVMVPPNELLSDSTGPHRVMPAILRRRDYETWLYGSDWEAYSVLQPYKAAWMQRYPVSPRINSLTTDDPGLIRVAS